MCQGGEKITIDRWALLIILLCSCLGRKLILQLCRLTTIKKTQVPNDIPSSRWHLYQVYFYLFSVRREEIEKPHLYLCQWSLPIQNDCAGDGPLHFGSQLQQNTCMAMLSQLSLSVILCCLLCQKGIVFNYELTKLAFKAFTIATR